jgi:hypothetical protein
MSLVAMPSFTLNAIRWFPALFLLGCGGGPYGHSVRYVPTSAEASAMAVARDFDPIMFERDPDAWRQGTTSLVGVVTSRAAGPLGEAYLAVSVRRLEPRNLCASANDEDTCRVTVTDRAFGMVHVVVALKGEDETGDKAVAPGSLVRVAGRLVEHVDRNDCAPVLRASFYRHWPRHYYVTRASAETMRQ